MAPRDRPTPRRMREPEPCPFRKGQARTPARPGRPGAAALPKARQYSDRLAGRAAPWRSQKAGACPPCSRGGCGGGAAQGAPAAQDGHWDAGRVALPPHGMRTGAREAQAPLRAGMCGGNFARRRVRAQDMRAGSHRDGDRAILPKVRRRGCALAGRACGRSARRRGLACPTVGAALVRSIPAVLGIGGAGRALAAHWPALPVA